MPETALAERSKMKGQLTSISNREKIADLKESVLDSEVAEDLILVAKTGYIQITEPDSIGGKITLERVDQGIQIDAMKFLVNKVLANARATEETSDKEAAERWAKLIQTDSASDSTSETEKNP